MKRSGALALLFVAAAALAVGGAGCKKRDRAAEVMAGGERLASGGASDLRTTPDGKYAVYLRDGEKPHLQGVPPQMVIGQLWAVGTGGGEAREIGNGVTNMPGGFTFSPDSKWVFFLSGYSPVEQDGTLHTVDLTDPKSKPVELGPNVTYMLASPDSKQVAFVSGGVLQIGPLPQGPFRRLSGEVQTLDFTRDSQFLFFKRRLSAAGGLFVWRIGDEGEPTKLGEQVGDFRLAANSKHVAFSRRSTRVPSTYELFVANAPEWAVKEVAAAVGPFAFSPDSKWLGRIQDQRVEDMGSLAVGPLHVGPSDGGPSRMLAKRVGRFEFAPTSDAIALLDAFDAAASKQGQGTIAVAQLPDGEPKKLTSRVPNFDWAPDGKSIAFIGRVFEPIYTIDLFFYALGTDAPLKINPGVFGYGYDATGKSLYFRTNCTGGAEEGRFCDLMRTKVSDPKAPPEKVTEGIYTWAPSKDGQRILLSYARRDSKLYDAAVLNTSSGERKTIAQYVQLPVFWIPGEAKVVYVAAPPAEPGVYVATQIP